MHIDGEIQLEPLEARAASDKASGLGELRAAKARKPARLSLEVQNFAQIDRAQIEFGDLTVLVGPQATGKSLLLQWLKLAIDHNEVVHALKEAGHDVGTVDNLLNLTFGEGMAKAWDDEKTSVRFQAKAVRPSSWTRGLKQRPEGKLFFIPAHRALLLAEGWPAPFLKLNADTPVVARLFSQNLYQRFSGRQAASLFPVERILKEQYRHLIDQAVFHGGKVQLEKEGLRYRLRLSYDGGIDLPFMTWTAGQREFTPLLLGLYHMLPSRQIKRRQEVDWVVIEEPEMGLHPSAITVFMLLVLDLLWRGYRVVLSTHSPLILDVVWAIRRLKEVHARWQLLAEAFEVRQASSVKEVMRHALEAEYRVYFMELDQSSRRVSTRDISDLDPEADNEGEATWGGLTGFSTRFGEAVRKAVNEAEPE